MCTKHCSDILSTFSSLARSVTLRQKVLFLKALLTICVFAVHLWESKSANIYFVCSSNTACWNESFFLMQRPGIYRPIVYLSESAEKPSLLCDRLRSQNCFQNSEAIKPKGRVALPKPMKFQKNSKRALAPPSHVRDIMLQSLGPRGSLVLPLIEPYARPR